MTSGLIRHERTTHHLDNGEMTSTIWTVKNVSSEPLVQIDIS